MLNASDDINVCSTKTAIYHLDGGKQCIWPWYRIFRKSTLPSAISAELQIEMYQPDIDQHQLSEKQHLGILYSKNHILEQLSYKGHTYTKNK